MNDIWKYESENLKILRNGNDLRIENKIAGEKMDILEKLHLEEIEKRNEVAKTVFEIRKINKILENKKDTDKKIDYVLKKSIYQNLEKKQREELKDIRKKVRFYNKQKEEKKIKYNYNADVEKKQLNIFDFI